MKVTFAPKDILQIDNARIIYRNFAGIGGKYNREGDRNFELIIEDEDIANSLTEAGWNIKIKPPRDEDDLPFMHMKVKVKYNGRGPYIYLKTGDKRTLLTEESVACLDNADILNVDMDIRPYDWEVNGKTGRSAYLQAMEVTQQINRFEEREREREMELKNDTSEDEIIPDDSMPF